MFRLLLIFCLISSAICQDKQIKLEDIERDNLAAEKKLKQISRVQHPLGPIYDTRPQQFIPSQPLPTSPAPVQYQAPLRQAQQFQYVPVNYQKPQQYSAPQQYLVPNEKYYTQPTYQHIQYVAAPMQNYQQPKPQNFYFLQPITTPNVPMGKVPGQKGPVQMVMLLDPNVQYLRNPHTLAHLLKEDGHQHNLLGLLQTNAHTNHINQNYLSPSRQTPPVQPQGVQPQPPAGQPQSQQPAFGFQNPLFYIQPQQQQQPQYYMVPISSFYQPQPSLKHRTFEQQLQQSVQNVAVLPKRQPTSLLDSYIPSVVQIQYLKQLQEAASSHVPKVVKYEGHKEYMGYENEK